MHLHLKHHEHLRELRARGHRPDDGTAFLPDHTDTPGSLMQSDGESFAEEFIAAATTGEHSEVEAQDEVTSEEWGGPFIEMHLDDLEEAVGDDLEPVGVTLAQALRKDVPRPG